MDIKQLKINGIAFYPKVPVEAIINVDPVTGEETTTPAIDTTVKPNSDNLVTSGAVYNAIQSSTIEVDDRLLANSANPVQNKVLNGTISGLQQSISGVSSQLNNKLSSGDLKTVNGQSLVGSGDITIQGGSDVTVDNALSTTSTNPVQNKIISGEIANLQYQITETANDLFNGYYTKTSTDDLLAAKQAVLVSGTNIKTINNQSILGSGNITISGGETVATQVKSLRFDDNATLALEGTDEVYVEGLDGITTGMSNGTTITIKLAEQIATDISNAVNTAAEAISAVGDLEESVPTNLADLDDVITTGLAAGKVLKYNGSKWAPADDNAGEGGSSITIDSALDTRSTNPVENKVVAGEIANLQYQITETADDLSNFYYTKTSTDELLNAKQNALVSGTNIKTVNNQSILGEGNITISGGGSITVDNALSNTSENPVQNKVIASEISSLSSGINSVSMNKQNKLVSGTNIKSINNQSLLGSGNWDSSIELVDHAVDGVTQKTVQYTKLGDSQATTLFDIDYKVKQGSWNPVASYAVYSAIGDKFTSLNTKYSQGVDLTGVVNYISHSETVVGSDLRGVTSMSMTITWFNACGDSGQSERLNKKTHTFDRVAMNFDGTQWDPQLMIDELNNQNSTDFQIQGRPVFTFTEESSGRYAISMQLGLSSAKYQVYSISNIKFYYAENELAQAAPPSTSIEYSYTYSSVKDGIYVDKSHNAILVCINNYWYKLADLEEFPIQPND